MNESLQEWKDKIRFQAVIKGKKPCCFWCKYIRYDCSFESNKYYKIEKGKIIEVYEKLENLNILDNFCGKFNYE